MKWKPDAEKVLNIREVSKMKLQSELTLKSYLDPNINEIINDFPQLAEILNKYDIGCVS